MGIEGELAAGARVEAVGEDEGEDRQPRALFFLMPPPTSGVIVSGESTPASLARSIGVYFADRF
jgi:hypothetical protein